MTEKIAVYQDPAIGEVSWAGRFEDYLAAQGVEVIPIRRPDRGALDLIRRADAFMWRFTHGPESQGLAKPFLSAVERGLGLPVWPNFASRWHYDDKVGQSWLLHLVGAPVPDTLVFGDPETALAWARSAAYPCVFKLRGGASSQSVCLVESPAAAERLICRTFDRGLSGHHDLTGISRGELEPLWRRARGVPGDLLRAATRRLRYGRVHLFEPAMPTRWPIESTAVLFQEFLAHNDFDCRVTVIGERAFAFRRFNRPGDFRASGSGRLDFDPSPVALDAVRMAHDLSERLGFQSMAYDFVRDADGRPRLLEISYTFLGDAVRHCPGYWDRGLGWHDGPECPARAIAEDLLREVRQRLARPFAVR